MDVVEGGKPIVCGLVVWILIHAVAINFLTFEEWQKLTPFPFTEASVNLDFEFARIRKTKYKVSALAFVCSITSDIIVISQTDYEFNRDLFNVIKYVYRILL